MTITTDLTFRELLEKPEVAPFKEFLLAGCNVPDLDWSLKEMNARFYDWVAESIAYGLSRLFTLMEQGVKVDYDIYTEEEKAAAPDMAGTKLFWFPGSKNAPFVMICPGGGYGAVCTLKEGFTTAARLNELGYNAFILSYRVRSLGPEYPDGIMPRPLEDLAAAMAFIRRNPAEFGVSLENYAVAGFSSGGHLAGSWATKHLGAVSCGLPGPRAVFLGYPASDTSEYRAMRGRNLLLEGMLGKGYTPEDVEKYNVNAHIDGDYPATYLWHCMDDEIIPVETSRKMAALLEQNGVPCRYREVRHGGHGFGLGEYSEARGWLEEAVQLWAEQPQKLVLEQ